MKSYRIWAPLIALSIGLIVTGCGSDTDDPGTGDTTVLDVDGRTFLSDNVMTDDQPMRLVKGSMLRLTFDGDTLGASAGCNTMSGQSSWDGNLLVVTALGSTEMACDPPLMDQDAWFADFLTSKPTVTQDGDSLTMTSNSTVIVLRDEEVVTPDASLTGTRWTLDSITSGDSVSSVPQGVTANVEFADDGSLTAALGCNRGSGNYTRSGSLLEFGPIASTQMACEPTASDVESAMLSVLQGSVNYAIDGDLLTLSPTTVQGDSPTSLSFRTN